MTHPAAELLRAIADGKQMELEYDTDWDKCKGDVALIYIGHGDYDRVRIARPRVTRQVSYPEPLRVKPEKGVKYWYMGPSHTAPTCMPWLDDEWDEPIFAAGMAFATEADAAEAHRALFGVGT